MYHISGKDIIRLCNDMNNIRMNKRILMKINREIEKWFLFLKLMASDISLNLFIR